MDALKLVFRMPQTRGFTQVTQDKNGRNHSPASWTGSERSESIPNAHLGYIEAR